MYFLNCCETSQHFETQSFIRGPAVVSSVLRIFPSNCTAINRTHGPFFRNRHEWSPCDEEKAFEFLCKPIVAKPCRDPIEVHSRHGIGNALMTGYAKKAQTAMEQEKCAPVFVEPSEGSVSFMEMLWWQHPPSAPPPHPCTGAHAGRTGHFPKRTGSGVYDVARHVIIVSGVACSGVHEYITTGVSPCVCYGRHLTRQPVRRCVRVCVFRTHLLAGQMAIIPSDFNVRVQYVLC